MAQDFSKGKIYKITNDFNDDVYIGSTCDTLVKRYSLHKASKNVENKMKRPLYDLMREIGTDRFRIELIEDCPCEDKYQLRQREGYWIRQMGTLNQLIAGRTNKEYNDEHKEYRKNYYEENKEEIIKKMKEYQEKHKELYQEIKKKSAEKHKEENIIRKKEWYENNKERISQNSKEIVKCECGYQIVKGALRIHLKTKKHINLLQQQLTVQTV